MRVSHADVNKIVNFSTGLIWRPASSEVIKEQQARLAVIAPSSNFGVFLSPLFLLFALAAEALFDVMPSDDVIAPSFRRSGVLRAWRVYSVDLTGASAVSASDTAVMLIVLVLIRGCFYGLEIGVSDYLRKSARAKPQNAEQEEEAHVVSPTKEMLAMIRMIVTVRKTSVFLRDLVRNVAFNAASDSAALQTPEQKASRALYLTVYATVFNFVCESMLYATCECFDECVCCEWAIHSRRFPPSRFGALRRRGHPHDDAHDGAVNQRRIRRTKTTTTTDSHAVACCHRPLPLLRVRAAILAF